MEPNNLKPNHNSARLSCRNILRYLPYSTEQNVSHGRQGKIVVKDDVDCKYKIELPLDIRGHNLVRSCKKLSPTSERKLHVKSKIWNDAECTSNGVCKEHYASYPPSSKMHKNILKKSKVEMGSILEQSIHKELSAEFEQWQNNSVQCRRIQHIEYRGIPPWGIIKDREYSEINVKMRIRSRIINEFFARYRRQCIFDAEEFLQNENGTEVPVFMQQLKEFVKRTKQILAFEWVVSIGRLMLEEKDVWVHLIADGNSMIHFDSVAATMARLLYDVICENIDGITKSLNIETGFARLRMLMNEDSGLFSTQQITNEIIKLAKIPRVEYKLYPRMFTKRYLDITDWSTIPSENDNEISHEFISIEKELERIIMKQEEYTMNQGDCLLWEQIITDLQSLYSLTSSILPTQKHGIVIYNRSKLRNKIMNNINKQLEKMKHDLIQWQATQNEEIRSIFNKYCGKLYGKELLTQLLYMDEVNKDVPILNGMIAQSHNVYNIILKYFILPDSALRDYYEISRLGAKLERLIAFVWDRIQGERDWVVKKVTDKTATHFFEGELIEKDYVSTTKRYRIAVRITEIQRIAAKFKVIAERSNTLLVQDEDLVGQRQLLGLPPFSLNINKIRLHAEYFGQLATLHYKTLQHEQFVLQAYVSDINLESVTMLTEELNGTKNQLDPKINNVDEEYLVIAENVINIILLILQKLSNIIPVLTALCSQGMKQKHWQQILSELKPAEEMEGNPKVCDVLAMNLTDLAQQFEETTKLAEEEKGLETFISTMKKQWEEATFDVKQPSFLSTELTTQMTSQIGRSHQLLSSPYAYTLIEQIKDWLTTLVQLHLFIDLHQQCYNRWRNIEGVFCTEDIAYQMPNEFRIFKKINVLWNTVNSRITGNRPILDQIEDVKEVNIILQEIMAEFFKLEFGFNAYLRKKRLIFPRFFVLSDSELLDLMAKSKDPPAINYFIPKLFARIEKFILNSRGEIMSVSTDSFDLRLSSVVNVNASKRHVEKWLNELDREIGNTIKLKVKKLLEEHKFEIINVAEVVKESVQIVLLYYRIAITNQIETAIRHKTLRVLYDLLNERLHETRQLLNEVEPPTKGIIQEYAVFFWIHHVKAMIDQNVTYVDDIDWTSKIRYYWHMDHIFVRVHFASVRYDYHLTTGEENGSVTAQADIGHLIVRSRLGLPSTVCDISIVNSLANYLGRVVSKNSYQSDNSSLVEGSLLAGAVFCTDYNSKIDILARNISYNIDRSSLKYITENEITINPSFTVIFQQCNMRTSNNHKNNRLKQLLKVYGFAESTRVAKRFASLCMFCTIFWKVEIPLDYLMTSIIHNFMELRKNNDLNEMQTCDYVIKTYVMNSLNQKQEDHLTSLLLHLPKDLRNEEAYMERKANQIVNLLLHCKVIFVVGEPLSGKSELIRKAVGKAIAMDNCNVQLTVHNDFSHLTSALQASKRRWLVFNGRLSPIGLCWLEQQVTEPVLATASPFSNIGHNDKLIIETEEIPSQLKPFIPVVRVDSQEERQLPNNNLTDDQVEQLQKIASSLDGLSRRLFSFRFNKIAGHFPAMNELCFESVVFVCIQSLLEQKFIGEVANNLKLNLANVFDKFHTQNDFVDLSELEKSKGVNRKLHFAVHWTELLLRLSFIPLLVVEFSSEQSILLRLLLDHLTRLFMTPILLTITPETTLDSIRSFMETCKILFVSETGNETGTVLILQGADYGCEEILEYLRDSENTNRFKFILIASVDISENNVRMRKCLFKVPYDNSSPNSVNVNPGLVFRSALKQIKLLANIGNIVNAELRKQLLTLTNYDEKYRMLCDELLDDYPALGENCAVDLDKLLDSYNEHEESNAARMGYRRHPKAYFTKAMISYMITVEEIIALPGRITILPGFNIEQVKNTVRIAVERHILSKITIKTSLMGVSEWKNTMLQVLDSCLINSRSTLLLIDCTDVLYDQLQFGLVATDLLSLSNKCMVPLHYLTRGFIANFSEKHTMEGRGIWAKLAEMIKANLRICVIITAKQFESFLVSERKLVYSSIIIQQEQTTLQKTSELIETIICDGDILIKHEIKQVLTKMMDVVTLIPNIEPIPFARLFVEQIKKKRKFVQAAIARYEKGMDKLRYAQEQTNHLQGELLRLQPELLRTAIETSILMSKIERETIEVENAREVVAANEHKANQAATKAQTLKAESEADLASSIPALEAAIESLSTMTQSDVSTLKTMRFPPYGVRLCMEAVCILLGVKPAKITDSLGGITEDYWIPGQKLLSDIHFLIKIRNYPRDRISNKTMRIIREKYLSKEEFDPENVKQCSLAAEGLCLWVKAIELYHRISKFVQPKKEKLRKAEILVKQHMKQLDSKRKALQEVTEKLQSLSDQFSQLSQRKQELQSQMTSCEMRMERAERLVLALGGEKHKWLSKIEEMVLEGGRLTQTSIITAVALLEYGKVNECERKKIVNQLERSLFNSNDDGLTDISNRELVKACTMPILILQGQGEDDEFIKILFPEAAFVTADYKDKIKMCMTTGTVFAAEFTQQTEELSNLTIYIKENKKITFLNNEEVTIEDGFRIILYSSNKRVEQSRAIMLINFTNSESDIRRKVAEALGRSNWPTYLENYNNSASKIKNTQQILEEMGTDMLEMLGNKDSLDEEKAIELLAQTKELNITLNILSTQTDMLSAKLNELEVKFAALISWALNLILILRQLGCSSPFQQYNLKRLIATVEYKLTDNIDEVDDSVTPSWISSLSEHIWTTMSGSLAPPIKPVLRYLMERSLMIGQYSQCGFKDFQRYLRNFKETYRFRELGSFIWKSHPSEPSVVVSDDLTCAWIYYVKDLSKNINVLFWPMNTMLKELLSKKLGEPVWVVISLNEWSDITSEAVIKTIQLLKTADIDGNFRLILTRTGNEGMPQEISQFSRRFAMQSAPSIKLLLKTTLEYSVFRQAYLVYNDPSQKQFIQLIVFFYAIYRRLPSVFTGIDLHFTLRAYMECHRHSHHSDLSTKDILTAVVEPILFNKLTKQFEVAISKTIFHWIFEGLSRVDDTALRNIIGNNWNELFNFTRQLLGAKKENVLALEEPLENWHIKLPPERNELSLWVVIWTELKEELQRAQPKKSRCIYLSKLLECSSINEINMSMIRQPTRLFYVITTEFAKKQHICLSQICIECSTLPFDKVTTSFLLTNCFLYGAQMHKSVDLIELTTGVQSQPSMNLYIRPVELTKLKANNNMSKIIPLLSNTGDILCEVRIRTIHAISHWTLRGAHFATHEETNEHI